MKFLIRFRDNWLIQLADMKEQEDKSVAEAEAYIIELYETGAVTPEQYLTLLNYVGRLGSYIRQRRRPVLRRWFDAIRSWCLYFSIQLRCTVRYRWNDLLDMVTPKPKPKPTVRMTFGEEEVVDE